MTFHFGHMVHSVKSGRVAGSRTDLWHNRVSLQDIHHSQLVWAETDVFEFILITVSSFSCNPSREPVIFSVIVI